MKLLVTGGAGFIGSNFILYLLRNYSDYEIVNVDKLTYASNLDYLDDVRDNSHYAFVKGDIADRLFMNLLLERKFDVIINFAAETHVDRSIADSTPFIHTNVLGTQVLLDLASKHRLQKFLQISTDEVYGHLELDDPSRFTEETFLDPRSPYSASKAGADMLVMAYHTTYELPVMITRCSNNYGPHQHHEKFIPTCITSALHNQKIPIYGDGKYVRDWIHTEDHCQAIDKVLHSDHYGEIFNVGGNNEWTNIDIAKLILKKLNKSEDLIEFVKDRPGHDRRYAVDSDKIERELGWKAEVDFEEGIGRTIEWYRDSL